MSIRIVALAASAALVIGTLGCAPVTPPPETATTAAAETAVFAPRVREQPLASTEPPRHALSYPYNLPQYTGGITAALEPGDASAAP